MKPRPLRIRGTGMAVPELAVPALEIDARAGLPAGWTSRHSGVETRYFSQGETASELGARAAWMALKKAGLTLADLDAVICVSGTLQQPIPGNAALLAVQLGPELEGKMTFDINSTCLGFLTGLDVVSAQLMAGTFRRALIVASDLASAGLNWEEPESCSILGDGAAAVIVEFPEDETGPGSESESTTGLAASPEGGGPAPGVLATAFGTWPRGASLTEIRGGGSGLPAYHHASRDPADYLFHMDGRSVFRLATELLPDFLRAFFSRHGLAWEDFALVIPHQASLTSLTLLRRRLGIPEDRFFVYARDYGNMIAASLPIGLHLALESGRAKPGDRVLLIGTSAGFSLGAVALQL